MVVVLLGVSVIRCLFLHRPRRPESIVEIGDKRRGRQKDERLRSTFLEFSNEEAKVFLLCVSRIEYFCTFVVIFFLLFNPWTVTCEYWTFLCTHGGSGAVCVRVCGPT